MRVPLFILRLEKPVDTIVDPSNRVALPETLELSRVIPLCADAIPMTGSFAAAKDATHVVISRVSPEARSRFDGTVPVPPVLHRLSWAMLNGMASLFGKLKCF